MVREVLSHGFVKGIIPKIFRVSDGALLRSLGATRAVAFSPDGQYIASTTAPTYSTRVVKLWNAANGTLLWTATGGGKRVVFAPDGQTIASADGSVRQVFEQETGWGQPPALALSRDGTLLAVGRYDETVEVARHPWPANTTTPPPLVNHARGGGAVQSSDGWGGVASRAVDGNTSGDWNSGSVTHTQQNAHAWWQVDLGAVRQIQTVKLWNRTDCCSERLSNFYVFVSDEPFASNDLTATMSQPGVTDYQTTGQGGPTTTVSVNRTGRYVRVQLAGTNYLSLAEVEVWGVSP